MADRLEQLRRLAAVGGLRAVPVHAGRDQERHPDAVRDRLPAGVRGDAARARSTTSSCACVPERAARRRAERRRSASWRPRGERHQAQARRVELAGAMAGALSGRAAVKAARSRALTVALSLETVAAPGDGDRTRCAAACRQPDARAPSGLDRAGALARSLISTHPCCASPAGGSCSPLERPCAERQHVPGARRRRTTTSCSGAAIVLPDHPQIAPESRGGLFDSTEIEEALLLHVQALSDGERAEIERPGSGGARDDRARGGATPEDISPCTAA